ncbi:MAG: GntR family transcriptional regulator [Acidobacteriaceae bacterium]|nr:GntR family transcriptional regulator [Acidobacteriaceae bacterium]
MQSAPASSYTVAVKRGAIPARPSLDKAGSIREKAYVLIQQKIARGELSPGAAVAEIALAKELGSSRTPIREALGQLVAEGLLEQTPNRGAVVVQLRRQDIADLYELREALEVYAVGKVAQRAHSDGELERLNNMVNEMAELQSELEGANQPELTQRQMRRFIACDLGFHSLLVRMAANSRILKLVNETRLLIRIFAIHRHGHNAAMLANIRAQHNEMIRAVSERNPQAAMQILSKHIQRSLQERLEDFDRWKHESAMRDTLPVFFDVHPASELI